MDQGYIASILRDHFDIQVLDFVDLPGYDVKNYKVVTDHHVFVLKVYPYNYALSEDLKAESRVLQQLSIASLETPRPILDLNGDVIHHDASTDMIFRLITYVNGSLWKETKCSDDIIGQLGSSLALLDRQLSTLEAPAINARRLTWDFKYFLDLRGLLDFIKDQKDRSLVRYFFSQWQTFILPMLPKIRQGLIHNDANDQNLLCQDGKLIGLIDFGDMAHTYIIGEVAIAATYLAMESRAPVEDITTLLKAYHNVHPLEHQEVEVLYYFIAARLCTSVLHSEQYASLHPDNTYAQADNKKAWKLLRSWIQYNPYGLQQQWKMALGLSEGFDNQHLRKRREKYQPGSYSLSYKRPIHMVSAAFQYMYDAEGHAILDAYNNIKQVGHCHPMVVEAGQRAMAKINTNTRYLYEAHARYSEHLLSYLPDHIDKLYLVNSGSAASDLAVRLARTFTQQTNLAVLQHGYHGNTQSTIDISHYKYGHKGGEGKRDAIIELDLPDTYNGKYQGPTATQEYITSAQAALLKEEHIAAFVAEPIVGCGGQVCVYLTKSRPALAGWVRHSGATSFMMSSQISSSWASLWVMVIRWQR